MCEAELPLSAWSLQRAAVEARLLLSMYYPVALSDGAVGMDFTPGTLVASRKSGSLSGVPVIVAPSKNKTLELTKVLSESDV